MSARQTGYVCERCGGPMEKVTAGGQEPDGNGGYRPCTRQYFVCTRAVEAWQRRKAELMRQLRDETAGHTGWVRLPWPRPKAADPSLFDASFDLPPARQVDVVRDGRGRV